MAEFENHHGGVQTTVSPIASVRDSQGVLGTATSPQGSIISRPLEPTDRVRIGDGEGIEVSVEQAVSKGLLEKTDDGGFRDVSGVTEAPSSPQDQNSKETPNENPESTEGFLAVSEGTQDALNDWAASAREMTGGNSSIVSMVGEVMEKGTDTLPTVLQEMCKHYGVSADQAKATMQEVVGDIQVGMAELVTAHGVDPQAFFDDVYTNKGAAFRAATIAAVFGQDTGPLSRLVSAFKRGGQGMADHDAGEAVMVTIDGHKIEMDKASARARGLI